MKANIMFFIVKVAAMEFVFSVLNFTNNLMPKNLTVRRLIEKRTLLIRKISSSSFY